ncbi:uncharacterized protein LOC134616996 [Pelmatolapia mariae]|uniref:uncharacterized protein LOC134616996 n=1 Tax=Pelmatolapia mariae TaxID=158779 RepID=UPI002FE6C37B
MSTVLNLREFIKERLTSAAEEIFSEFEKTIVRYEEEISQLRLLNIRPGIKSHNTGLDDQQVCVQERSSSLNQEDPEPPQTKEEQEEIYSSEEREQLELKQEDESIHVWTGEQLDLLWKPGVKQTRIGLDDQQVFDQERSSSLNQEDPEPPQTTEDQEEMCSNQEEEQLALTRETKGIIIWTGQELGIMWNPEVELHRIGFCYAAAESEGVPRAEVIDEDLTEDQQQNHNVMEAVDSSCVGQVEVEVPAANVDSGDRTDSITEADEVLCVQ